eukprot:SM012185S25972  [mRNA]  locus=s12185:185:325:- [translate_table: standard]
MEVRQPSLLPSQPGRREPPAAAVDASANGHRHRAEPQVVAMARPLA